jgi:pilus assembly protein CpaB
MANRQTLIALGVALVLGLLAVWMANSFLSGRERLAYNGATTKVAVAAAPLAYGNDITADKVRFVDFPNSSIPPGAFTDGSQLLPAGKKRIALLPISLNEPILAGKISGIGEGASIAALLPDGMRAASVRINDVSGVAGFVQPNDSVDVLITRQVTAAGGNQQVTDVLLQNVHVLAIGQTAKDANGEPILARTATFAVTPIDAQKLALGQQVGDLSLVLRKPGEQNNPVVETVSMNDLRYNMYGGARYPAPAVVGTFGSGLGGAIAGSMEHSASVIANAHRPARRVAAPAKAKNSAPADAGKQIQVYRGTKSDQVNVGG